jgi:biotin transporter BioY
MSALPPEARDLRQTLWIILICFVAGFVVTLAGLSWLVFHFAWNELAWWKILPTFAEIVIVSVLGGLAFCAGAVILQGVWHKWRGTYRCPKCNRALRSPMILCECERASRMS